MPSEALVNLHRIGQLKSEPRDDQEFERLLKMAKTRLLDAQLKNISSEGRFNSFPVLSPHDQLATPPMADLGCGAPEKNFAEYEGYWDIEESAIVEICNLLPQLIAATEKLKSTT